MMTSKWLTQKYFSVVMVIINPFPSVGLHSSSPYYNRFHVPLPYETRTASPASRIGLQQPDQQPVRGNK